MANRAVDLVITYRVVKLLATPFEKQEAFKYGIIDKDGKVLRKFRTLKTTAEKKSYTMLHRFIFNLKRILAKAGLGGRFGKATDGSDINDDGISHKKEGGLKMEISYETLRNGTSKVYAKLV